MEDIDSSLAALRSQISHLQKLRSNLATALTSSSRTTTRVEQYQQRPRNQHNRNIARALDVLRKQEKHTVRNVHRTCAGVTALKIKDPDPYAIDEGNVLGVTIEVFIDGTFRTPYYLLLTRNPSHPTNLKLHHHTIPPSIPLVPLAAKYLPQPASADSTAPTQNLHGLTRVLRKELVSYHLRVAAIEKLRVKAGLPARTDENNMPALGRVLNSSNKDEEHESSDDELVSGRRTKQSTTTKITDIDTDAAVRELIVQWRDGVVGRMKITTDGRVEKAVVRSLDGDRLSGLEKASVGRIESLESRLSELSRI